MRASACKLLLPWLGFARRARDRPFGRARLRQRQTEGRRPRAALERIVAEKEFGEGDVPQRFRDLDIMGMDFRGTRISHNRYGLGLVRLVPHSDEKNQSSGQQFLIQIDIVRTSYDVPP